VLATPTAILAAATHAYTLPPALVAKAQALESDRTALYFAGTAWTILALFLLVRGRTGERIASLAERLTSRRFTLGLKRPGRPDLYSQRPDLNPEHSKPSHPSDPAKLSEPPHPSAPPAPPNPPIPSHPASQGEERTAPAPPRPWLAGLIAAPLWLLLLTLISLPAEIIGHHVSLLYGLSIERWPAWSLDWLKSTLITLALGTLILSALYALLRHTRAAWLWFWLATLPFIVLGVFAAPLLIDPLFNHFTPLAQHDPSLVSQLERVVQKGGLAIPPSRMFVMDASRRSTGMNAYVTGFGSSKRVVVWDTTLPGGPSGHDLNAGVPSDELLDIYGHEQGHYVLGHIWKGMLYSALLLFVFYWLAFRLLHTITRSRGPAWHIADNPSDWSSLGLLLLIASVLGLLADPLANAFSRMQEHQADVYGQEVIHGLVPNPQQVAVADFNRLGRVWLEDPDPNRFVVWWTYSHPPTSDRADFAAHYDPWDTPGTATGTKPHQHPRYFPY
jgi:Zn-dependent protease with chaperone function